MNRKFCTHCLFYIRHNEAGFFNRRNRACIQPSTCGALLGAGKDSQIDLRLKQSSGTYRSAVEISSGYNDVWWPKDIIKSQSPQVLTSLEALRGVEKVARRVCNLVRLEPDVDLWG